MTQSPDGSRSAGGTNPSRAAGSQGVGVAAGVRQVPPVNWGVLGLLPSLPATAMMGSAEAGFLLFTKALASAVGAASPSSWKVAVLVAVSRNRRKSMEPALLRPGWAVLFSALAQALALPLEVMFMEGK